MRPTFLLLVLLFLTVVPTRADEPAPDDARGPQAVEDWDAERFWFAEVLAPAKAWQRISTRVRQAPRQEMRALQQSLVATYLAVWKGDVPEAKDRLALATMYRYGQRPGDALVLLGEMLGDDTLQAEDRANAALQLASIVGRPPDDVEDEILGDAVGALRRWVARGEGDVGRRASVLFGLANHAAGEHDVEEAVRWNMEAARADPSRAAQAGRSVKRLLMGWETDAGAYDALRSRTAELFGELRALAQQNLDAVPEGADDDRRARAEAVVRLLQDGEQPFAMLGETAPAWTLEHAFTDVEDLESLRGKVVILDFWATWCGWCIKSFPAVRDLLRDYEDQGLVVVGVTTTHRTVYPSRFDLDDDMKAKWDRKTPIRPAAVLAGGRPPAAGVPVLESEAYREKEREVLEGFIAAHEMSWPVVMIDAAEPKAKYALMGWPHAVVLDREGRVRFFKSGALLRDRPEQVARFREKLEKLLAETAK